MFIKESADDSADRADIHNAGYSQVQVAGFLCDGLPGAAIHKRNTLHYDSRNK